MILISVVLGFLVLSYLIWLRRRIDQTTIQAECVVCGETTYTSAHGVRALGNQLFVGYPEVLVFVSCWCCNASLYESLKDNKQIAWRFNAGVTQETKQLVEEYNYRLAQQHLQGHLFSKYTSRSRPVEEPPNEEEFDI